MKSAFILVLLLISASILGCASQMISPEDVAEPVTWGGSENVTQLRHLYFSGQPDAEALRTAKARGVIAVINVRDPSESDWDEQAAAESAGLSYFNVPIARQSKTLSSESIARISDIVRELDGEPVLLHCASGNRAAAWLAVHLVEDHALTDDDAIAVAEKAGLTHDGTRQRAQTYLSDRN